MAKRDSVLFYCVSVLFQILFPLRLLHNIEQRFLSSTAGPPWFSVVNRAVCAFLTVFSGGASGKEPTCQCRRQRYRFNPRVGKIPWRRAWQPTPVFLPGESHGQRNLAGYSPRGRRVGYDWACARMSKVIVWAASMAALLLVFMTRLLWAW